MSNEYKEWEKETKEEAWKILIEITGLCEEQMKNFGPKTLDYEKAWNDITNILMKYGWL